MFSFFKRLFQKSNSTNSKVFTGNYSSGTSVRVGIPAEFIPDEYLDDLKNHFSAMGIVKRAAYGLMEVDGNFSYMIALDLEVESEQKQKAIQAIAHSINTRGQIPYKGRWPLDFVIWRDDLINPILTQKPNFEFFKRP